MKYRKLGNSELYVSEISLASNIHNSQTSSNKVWKPIEVTQSFIPNFFSSEF